MKTVERARIKPEDVRAVIINNNPFHLDCLTKEQLRALKLEDFLLNDEYHDDTGFEFCTKCRGII